jgi:hypothetical protein
VPLLAALWWAQQGSELRRSLEAELAARQALAERQEALARTRAELMARLASDPRPIRAASATLAVAELQSAFATLAEEAGVTVESTQILAAEQQGGFHRLRLRAMVETDHAGLRDWLFALAQSRPLLAVDSLTIRPRSQAADRLMAEIVVSNPALLQPSPGADSGAAAQDGNTRERRTP